VFEALGQDAERKRLDAGNGFVAILAIAQSPRQVANLPDPPTAILGSSSIGKLTLMGVL
jgi:hypothetical protein